MDHIKWIDKQRARRERLGISQEDFAVLAGMSRTHLSRLESHASPVTKKAMRKIEHAFALAAPDALFLLIDYVHIRFKTTDARHIIEDVLRIRMKYMAQEPKGAYTYTGRYYHGDIVRIICLRLLSVCGGHKSGVRSPDGVIWVCGFLDYSRSPDRVIWVCAFLDHSRVYRRYPHPNSHG